MIQSAKKSVRDLVSLCKAHGVENVVFSPGSRNAPLVIGFTNDDYFTNYVIPDERVAAFFAMGMAQASKKPVVICCTSGSAALNYYPAIAEAFYQRIPLVVVTADRPAEWVDQNDGQTIRQNEVFSKHIRYEVSLFRDVEDFQTIAYNQRVINEALNASTGSNRGPVHINIPFDEPLYDVFEGEDTPAKAIFRYPSHSVLSASAKEELNQIWSSYKRKIILIGQSDPNSQNEEILKRLAQDPTVVVLFESTSNLKIPEGFGHIDRYLMPLSGDEQAKLKPELLITLGGAVVSKKVKAFLRTHRPIEHWHVGEGTPHPDTYQVLTRSIDTHPEDFLNSLSINQSDSVEEYKRQWLQRKESSEKLHNEYVSALEWGDMQAIYQVLNFIPDEADLHLANSTPIRYAQLFEEGRNVHQYCNRGTSGIDGTTSTAAGFSIISNVLSVVLTGDISFFYDSNALFNNHLSNQLRIIVINNGGGGIFRYIPGPQSTGQLEKHFESHHGFTAEGIAKSFNLDYDCVSSEAELVECLQDFYSPSKSAKILEVFTPHLKNAEQLKQYFSALK